MMFPSKRDMWMGMIIWGVIFLWCWILYEAIFVMFNIITIVLMPILISLLISIWFYTRYTIKQETLQIAYGPMKWNVNIQDIHYIREIKNPFTAPALSMEKLEVHYGKYETIVISPKDKKAFIHTLQMKNPRIEMKN